MDVPGCTMSGLISHIRSGHARLAAYRFVTPYRKIFVQNGEGKSWPRWRDTWRAGLAYFHGLLRPGRRKNLHGIAVSMGISEDRMERFVRESPWEYEALQEHLIVSIPEEIRDSRAALVIDDFGIVKQGSHSVGVQRQYSGTLGKVGNCQVAVDLVYASPGGRRNADQRTWPLGIQLYLPESWTEDEERRAEVDIPDDVVFRTKPVIAQEMIEAVLSKGVEHSFVVSDAGYGDNGDFRRWLRTRNEAYVLGVNPDHIYAIDPSTEVVPLRGGRRSGGKFRYPEGLRPRSAKELARDVEEWTEVEWSEGTKGSLKGHFHRILVRVTTDTVRRRMATDEVGWLLLERRGKELKSYICWGMDDESLEGLVGRAHLRWVVEHFHREAKQMLGLDRFEGRTWRGWHHHVSMVMLAYSFLSKMRAESAEEALPSLRSTAVQLVQEVITQELIREHGLKRTKAHDIATTMRRGFTDWL